MRLEYLPLYGIRYPLMERGNSGIEYRGVLSATVTCTAIAGVPLTTGSAPTAGFTPLLLPPPLTVLLPALLRFCCPAPLLPLLLLYFCEM